jgi:hypothetical protein
MCIRNGLQDLHNLYITIKILKLMETSQKRSAFAHLLVNFKLPTYLQTLEALWLIVIFAIPLVFNPFGYFEFYLAKALFIRFFSVVMLALVIGHWVWKGGRKIAWRKTFFGTPLHSAILIFGLAFSISTIFSVDPSISFWGSLERNQGWFTLISWIIFFFILCNYLQSPSQVVRIGVALVISSGLVSVAGIMQYYLPATNMLFFHVPLDPSHRIISTTGNALSLSSFLAMSIPFNLGLAGYIWKNSVSSRKGLWLTLLGLLLFLQVWSLFLAQYSITILLFAVAPIIFFLIWGLLRSRIIAIFSIVVGVLLVLLASLLVIPTWTSNVSTDNNTLYSAEPFSVESLGIYSLRDLRVHYWKHTVELWWHSPQLPAGANYPGVLRKVVGYGPENYLALLQQNYPETQSAIAMFESRFNDQPHNQYLYFLSTTGALGLIAYISILAGFGIIAYSLLRNRIAIGMSWFAIAAIAAVAQYSADLFFNPATPSGDIVFWLCLALIGAFMVILPRRYSLQTYELPKQPSLIFKPLAILIGFSMIAFNTSPIMTLLKAESTYQKAVDAISANNSQSIFFLDIVTRTWPQEAYYWGAKAGYIFNTEVRVQDTSQLDYCVESYRQAILRQPCFAFYYVSLAEVYRFWAIHGSTDSWGQAYSIYQQADKIFPHNAVVQAQWALVLYQGGYPEDATAHLIQSYKEDTSWFQKVANSEYGQDDQLRRFGVELNRLNRYVPIREIVDSLGNTSTENWLGHILTGIAYDGNNDILASELDAGIRAAPLSKIIAVAQYVIELIEYDQTVVPAILPFVPDWYSILEQTPGGADTASQLRYASSI